MREGRLTQKNKNKKYINYIWGIYINMKNPKDRKDEVYTLFWTKEKKVSV